ncbi:mitochondrial distribution and morphology protein 12-like [Mangifera indica]|uniref:mitochondrial distribution and morphology protein 12-like n=1 Tax=Mangifera indica TaxID=29780 RepID=UPI001CFB9277|nr:mitochondrial distribution and morphology protein 12-like [Mangifera indica]
MENRYGYFRQGSGVWRSITDGDFEEEDIWAVLKERREDSSTPSSKVTNFINSEFESSISVQRRLPSAARMIPITTGNGGYTSSSSNSNNSAGVTKLQSAPVKIPDWSNFNGRHHQSKKSSKNVCDDDDDEEEQEEIDDDDDDDGYDSKAPPHEFIARRQARSQISSFSVFEGVGRTLKGRDLSKVRNAVLTRTGFLEK